MRSNKVVITLIGFVIILVLFLGGCNLRSSGAPSPTAQINATQSYQTAVARVTQFFLETAGASGESTGEVEPTPTSAETETPTPTETVTATPPPPTARPTNTPEPCDKAAPGSPIDVTIPDDTVMTPGQTFQKTWRLINTGTCTWNNQYAVVWVSGEKLASSDVFFISGSVAPGQSIDITVPMTAPTAAGSYQSNWRLRNSAGVLFGIGERGDAAFWVRIKVSAATSTPTVSPTPAVTATATPVVFSSNSVNLMPSNTLDLDNIVINPGGGQDLTYSLDGGGNHLLSPTGGAQIGVFGQAAPGLGACKAASLGSAPLAVESVGAGSYLCYRTDAGRYGRLLIASFNSSDGTLSLQAVTWVSP